MEKTKPRKEFTVSEKLEILDLLKTKKCTRSEIKFLYNCDHGAISRMLRCEERLRQIPNSEHNIRSRVQNKPISLVTEAITQWYRMMRSQDAFINSAIIRNQAKKFAKILNVDFNASNGWLYGWQKRENVVFQKTKRGSNTKRVNEAVTEWYRTMRSKNAFINGPIIKKQAKKFAKKFNIPFNASDGWLGRWQKSENVVFRKTKQDSAAKGVAETESRKRILQELLKGTVDKSDNLIIGDGIVSSMTDQQEVVERALIDKSDNLIIGDGIVSSMSDQQEVVDQALTGTDNVEREYPEHETGIKLEIKIEGEDAIVNMMTDQQEVVERALIDKSDNLIIGDGIVSSMTYQQEVVEQALTGTDNVEREYPEHETGVKLEIKIEGEDVPLPPGTPQNYMPVPFSANSRPSAKETTEKTKSSVETTLFTLRSPRVKLNRLRTKGATYAGSETPVLSKTRNEGNGAECDTVPIPSKDEAHKAFDILLQYLSANGIIVKTLDDVGKHLTGETSGSTTEILLHQKDHDEPSIPSIMSYHHISNDIDKPEEIHRHIEKPVQEIRRIDDNISQSYDLRDQYTVYGENVANRLRNCLKDDYDISIAQHNIDNTLFELTMDCYSRSQMTSNRNLTVNPTISRIYSSSAPYTSNPTAMNCTPTDYDLKANARQLSEPY